MMNFHTKVGFLILAVQLSGVSAFADTKDNASEGYAAFKPHWGFMIGLNSSGTPGDKGGGQNANDISFTVSREFSEAGDFLSAALMGGSQKVDGTIVKYGSLSLDGGLGMGIFTPSLSLSAQTGEKTFAVSSGLNLGFQIVNDINVGLIFTGGLSNRQAPNLELDSKNFGGGLSVIWATSDIFSLSLSGLTTADAPYQYKLIGANQSLTIPLPNQQMVVTPSSSIGFNWAFIKDFTLSGSFQRSEEFEPAGPSYSPSLGEFTNNANPETLYFSGYNVGLTYSFQ